MTPVESKPPFYLFLAIHGTLITGNVKSRAANQVAELKGRGETCPVTKQAIQYLEPYADYIKKQNSNAYSENAGAVVNAHYFPDETLQNLNHLIERIKTVAEPRIIITDCWREERTVEDLKNIYLGMHPFSHFIYDKTPETLDGEKLKDRQTGICEWNSQHSVTENFVILDGPFTDGVQKFGSRLVPINYLDLITREDVNKALQANELTKNLASTQHMDTSDAS